jgi:hypothetical protein
MDPLGRRIDLSRIEREIQKCTDPDTARALRALLDAVRHYATRLDALEAWKAAVEAKEHAAAGPKGDGRSRG